MYLFKKLVAIQHQQQQGPEDNDPIIDRLVELRVVLEKCKPLESKLKYQLDKLIKAVSMADHAGLVDVSSSSNIGGAEASSTSATAAAMQNPLAFKPNPSNLIASFAEEGEGVDGGYKESSPSNVYKPPRVAPTHFPDPSSSASSANLSRHAKHRALNSRLLQELRTQFDHRPETQSAHGTGYATSSTAAASSSERVGGLSLDKVMKDREEFEEANFVRMGLSRVEKRARRAVAKRGGLMRFDNEFKNLNHEFSAIQEIDDAVQKDQASTFRNSDVLRRRHESKLQQSTGNKKRKFADATDRISSVAAAVQDKKGDVFRKRVLAIRKHKKSKK